MEPVTLLRLARRYWLLILLPAVIAGGLSLWFDLQRPPRYVATARLLVTYPVVNGVDTADTWQMTDYLIDDLPQVLSSAAFAARVEALLAARGVTLSQADIQQGVRIAPLHRAIDLSGEAASPAMARALVEATIDTLRRDGLTFWGRTDAQLSVVVLDEAGEPRVARSLRAMLFDAALRAALGLVAGFALAVGATLFSATGKERPWKSVTM